MSYKSQHMNHVLKVGRIRGNVSIEKLDDVFELDEDKLRKVSNQHMGNTKWADFQVLYFFIKNNFDIPAAAKDLGMVGTGNFTRRLGLINVLDFAVTVKYLRNHDVGSFKNPLLTVEIESNSNNKTFKKPSRKSSKGRMAHGQARKASIIAINALFKVQKTITSKDVQTASGAKQVTVSVLLRELAKEGYIELVNTGTRVHHYRKIRKKKGGKSSG